MVIIEARRQGLTPQHKYIVNVNMVRGHSVYTSVLFFNEKES